MIKPTVYYTSESDRRTLAKLSEKFKSKPSKANRALRKRAKFWREFKRTHAGG